MITDFTKTMWKQGDVVDAAFSVNGTRQRYEHCTIYSLEPRKMVLHIANKDVYLTVRPEDRPVCSPRSAQDWKGEEPLTNLPQAHRWELIDKLDYLGEPTPRRRTPRYRPTPEVTAVPNYTFQQWADQAVTEEVLPGDCTPETPCTSCRAQNEAAERAGETGDVLP